MSIISTKNFKLAVYAKGDATSKKLAVMIT